MRDLPVHSFASLTSLPRSPSANRASHDGEHDRTRTTAAEALPTWEHLCGTLASSEPRRSQESGALLTFHDPSAGGGSVTSPNDSVANVSCTGLFGRNIDPG